MNTPLLDTKSDTTGQNVLPSSPVGSLGGSSTIDLQSLLSTYAAGGQTGGLNLASLLAAQAAGGQTGGLDLASLLATQAAGGQTSGLDLSSLLAAQGGNGDGLGDDRLNIMLRFLEQRRATNASNAIVEQSPSEAEVELQRLEALQQRRERQNEQHEQAREIKRTMKAMFAELEILRARNDVLAAALGACYLCFGEDLNCPECGGQGGPGSLMPEAAAFRKVVAPAVSRVRAASTKGSGGIAPHKNKEHSSQVYPPVPNPNPPVATD